ncbi:hypothetical protein NDU88_000504 [Pleurodeles waltl]|uniref:Uncharacterized protein n=1 Tax=Pleurodeles waltl TaxID=8319 RepID=A0AAV7SWV6_PLEWA|nr:hypothetical protein NDU88_000504 [Pleurodeles waltl]
MTQDYQSIKQVTPGLPPISLTPLCTRLSPALGALTTSALCVRSVTRNTRKDTRLHKHKASDARPASDLINPVLQAPEPGPGCAHNLSPLRKKRNAKYQKGHKITQA